MAMIISAFVSAFTERLSKLIGEGVGMSQGVEAELKRLERKLCMIQDVLEDAERKAFHDKVIRSWVAELKQVMYDADDIIDDCRIKAEKHDTRLLKRQRYEPSAGVRFRFPSSSYFSEVSFRHKIGKKIKSINGRLEEISKERSQFQLTPTVREERTSRISRQTSPVLESDIVGMGIEDDTNSLVELLTKEDRIRGNLVFAILGMGGIGKTTLAQKVYDNEQIKANFQIKIWVCVSKDFEETKLLKEIISGAGRSHGKAQSRAQLEPLLREVVEQKKFFLVLDDVWSMHLWEDLLRNPLQNAAAGSRILITSRDQRVAWQMGAIHLHHVKLLSVEDGWSLLCKKVFPSGEEEEILRLRDIGIKIVEKCSGLPLAIKTIAGVLRTKIKNKGEWEKVLSNPAWTSSELPEGIMGALYLSYEDLPSYLKQCFAYCSLFPEDYLFKRASFGRLWIAEGFLIGHPEKEEELAETYFKELVERNLLQPDPLYFDGVGCKIHDLLRALAQFVARDENLYGDLQVLRNKTALVKPRRVSVPADSRELVDLLDVIKKQECLRTLLLIGNPFIQMPVLDDLFKKLGHLRILDLSETGIESLPNSMVNLIHLKHLRLSNSEIRELPESIEHLRNLQYLLLKACKYLHNLPMGITKLYKLRTLNLRGTPLDRIPAGIGRLERLNSLTGFVSRSSNNHARGGSTLEELGSLPLLKSLYMEKLERVSSRAEASGAALRHKSHLKELALFCTPQEAGDGQSYVEDTIKRLEKVFEELCPPPCLEVLRIQNFIGREYPSWMSSSSSPGAVPLASLRYLVLQECPLWQQLPPLGHLPYLNYFYATGLHAVVTIGPEFLGSGSSGNNDGVRRSFFPKLEELCLQDMDNLEEWSCRELEEEEKADGVALQLLPLLRELILNKCPKLKSLPQGLLQHATNLTKLKITNAHSLREIRNLTSIKQLDIWDNPNLEILSNLPVLGSLTIHNCPTLKSVEKLNALWFLNLTDNSMESLPDWLGLLGHQNTGSGGAAQLHKLQIQCKASVLRRCLIHGGPDWPKIQHFPHVYACTEDKGTHLTYTKTPFSFSTNMPATTEEEINI